MSIFERKQEKTLFEVKEFLVSIIGSAPYGIVAFDLEGEVSMINSLGIKYLGNNMSVNSAIGKDILELLKDIPLLLKTVKNYFEKDRQTFNLPSVQIKEQFMSIKGRLILNGTILVIEDITAQKRIENELEKANTRLQELDRMKSIFIASMSHELRTPLNSIIGFTGLILQGISGKVDDEAKKDLQIVFNSSKHLLGLINDVIDISKIETDMLEVYFEKIKLDDLLNEVINTVLKDARKKNLNIKTNFTRDFFIVSDKKRLFQCILNFVSNAVKYTEKGYIELRATIKANILEISVHDTGIGIKKEDLPKLFNSFIRLDSPLKERTSGTGLGLYLTKKIMVSVFNGNTRVKSTYGRGSTFTLIMPIDKEL